MNRSGGLYRITAGLTLLAAVLALSWLAAFLTSLGVREQLVLSFFILSFGCFTVFLHAWAQSLSGSSDEKGKGEKALGGLVGHFGGSLAILLLYFFFFYRSTLFEVWTALITYVISFIVFIYLLMRMR